MMTICFRNVAGQRDRSQMRPCEAHLLLQIWNKGSASYMNCWVICPAKGERKYDLVFIISRYETKAAPSYMNCWVICPAKTEKKYDLVLSLPSVRQRQPSLAGSSVRQSEGKLDLILLYQGAKQRQPWLWTAGLTFGEEGKIRKVFSYLKGN